MTALDECIAAVTAAREQRDRAAADAARRHDKAVTAAADALEAALDRHDKAVAAAEADKQSTAAAADATYRAALAEAEAALDEAKQREHSAGDARIEGSAGGTLWLKAGRQTLGSATPVADGNWRINGPNGIVFIPDAPTARAVLWDLLSEDTDLTGALQAHIHRPELAAATRR